MLFGAVQWFHFGLQSMLWMVSSIKLLTEIGLLALLGRGILRLWLGRLHPSQMQTNVFLKLLEALSAPWLWMAQGVSPRFVLPSHWPWIAFLMAVIIWLVATVAKVSLCVSAGLEVCR